MVRGRSTLGSSVEEGNNLLVIDLMNPDLVTDGEVPLQKGTLHIFRAKLLWQDACLEHIRVSNHGREAATVRLEFVFEGDFVDLFEVRGMVRQQCGERLPSEIGPREVVLPYRGRDGLLRRTRVAFEPAPTSLDAHRASFTLRLDPGAEHHLYCTVSCEAGGAAPAVRASYQQALSDNNADRAALVAQRCTVVTSNPLVNLWLDRSMSDLAMLTTVLPTGPYPFAGVPWYSTTFGRDGILTAMEYLWVDPSLGRGVLAFLAATQATDLDTSRDAEPGKILHEARQSEMANTREIPFGRYYGTVDATPLFLVLAAAYSSALPTRSSCAASGPTSCWRCSGSTPMATPTRMASSNTRAAAPKAWCSKVGRIRTIPSSMPTARWRRRRSPCARYRAMSTRESWASLQWRGSSAKRRWRSGSPTRASVLRERFQQAFWCEEIGSYVIALDGEKRQCKVASSNAGHALWSGIAAPEHAARIVAGMQGPEFFSGWGIRTIASGQARYNPMSYHNGSIWPHDNALIAAGMARYGHNDAAVQLLSSLFDASLHFESNRLPELFCGFPRRHGAGPTLYPVACSPQAWAAASVFGMLQACLGLELDAGNAAITLRTPQLPVFIDWIRISRLGVEGASADLLLKRHERNVGIEVIRKDAGVRVTAVA